LTNTLAHSDIIITMYSTFFIEGASFNKPLIGIAFDGLRKRTYWNSASRFFEWDHLREIKPLDGIWLVQSEEELSKAIEAYLKNPEYLERGREKIIQQQCEYTDGQAGKRVAKAIQRLLQ
jgi:CDP-glycerol glycerophosphotransferase (TagB/SpsB family)